jgi:hypothetical protein
MTTPRDSNTAQPAQDSAAVNGHRAQSQDAFAPIARTVSARPSQFDLVCERLEERGCRPTAVSGGFQAHCPAHHDATPSLSVGWGDDGRVLVHCHAGCEDKAICAALDLDLRDLFPAAQRPTGHRKKATPTEEVAEPLLSEDELQAAADALLEDGAALSLRTARSWSLTVMARYGLGLAADGSILIPVRASDGTLLTVERYFPPSIRGDGPKMVALGGRERELLLPPGGIPSEVHIFEGYADALAAASADIAAIGAPSANWCERFTDVLRTAGVTDAFIVGDCDNAGRTAFVAKAVESLSRAGIIARAIDLDPTRSDKYDFTDLILEHGRERASEILAQLASDATLLPDELREETSALLRDTDEFLRRRVVLPEELAYIALDLWISHTHAIDAAQTTPYLAMMSPQPDCGKTHALETFGLVVRKPWMITGAPSEAVLFRKIDADQPTVLLDEVDRLFKGSRERVEPLTAILNGGNRRGATVPRCVGPELAIHDFSVYGPKALSGIDASLWPDTLRDRAIIVRIERLLAGESIERSVGRRRRRIEAQAKALHDRWEAWATRAVPWLLGIEPEDIPELSPRAFDGWEPLLAIAELAGGAWAARAIDAARRLSSTDDAEDVGTGVVLLRAIRRAFGDARIVYTADLLEALNRDETLPFGGWNNGAGITDRELARHLKGYGPKPSMHRVGPKNARGYRREDFKGPWARYVPDVALVADVAELEGSTDQPTGASAPPTDPKEVQHA